MSKCRYCGKNAGWFREYHQWCKDRNDNSIQEVHYAIRDGINKHSNPNDLKRHVEDICSKQEVSNILLLDILEEEFDLAIDVELQNGIISEESERRLKKYIETFDGEPFELEYSAPADIFNSFCLEELLGRSKDKMLKAATIRDLLNGEMPNRFKITGPLPFNLLKSEQLIWFFNGVKYYERQTTREYVGGHQGFSMRVAKGLYYRAGAHKGRRVERTDTVHADSGLLGVTNKHLYFHGPIKRFRIRHDKIVSFEPYPDGVGIQKDLQSATPQTFITGDGWFIYNLLTNCSII